MDELKRMAIDTSTIVSLIELFDSTSVFMAEYEFEEERYIYPVGILDFNFDVIDLELGLSSGILSKSNELYSDNQPTNFSICEIRNTKLVAPLFDLYSSDDMGLVFRSSNFYSNYRTIKDIEKLEIYKDSIWTQVQFDEIFEFSPEFLQFQEFKFRISYLDGTSFTNKSKIFTPEIELKSNTKKEIYKEDDDEPWICVDMCHECGDFEESGNKLKWCYIPSCSNENVATPRPKKPYILVTGFRPPMFGQGFKKTWTLYSDNHENLLSELKDNDYDIFLVKFNIHVKPYKHGMKESADLMIQFLEYLNGWVADSYNENVIQGSSMGSEIVRLALLKMEKKHLENNTYAHHHSRLFISYDANFYGANIPLAYQYQIYSGYRNPAANVNPIGYSFANQFLQTFLFATLEQKSVKELLMYHAAANKNDIFFDNNQTEDFIPTHHPKRQEFYDALTAVDNGQHIFPMPVSCRNNAISLGKIEGINSTDNALVDKESKPAGEYWRDQYFVTYHSTLRSGIKYLPNEYTVLFRRKKIGISFGSFSLNVNHKISVRDMEEIDDAGGSYLIGLANIISVTDWAYFTLQNLVNGRNVFSHKATVTALGINKNLWPADGSMNVNVQTLGLMYNDRLSNGILIQSNYYGYPNLGRPNDHFQVTPFEAVYVDNRIDPHIVLEEAPAADVQATKGFILNETEPWYLGLQNQRLGSLARPNYTYRSKRIALHGIVVGNNVTPTTDIGNYSVEANGALHLRAGDYIHVYPGTHFKPGSVVHLKIHYEGCLQGKSLMSNDDTNEGDDLSEVITEKEVRKVSRQLVLYPNPSETGFTLAAMDAKPISSIEIYNLNGILQYTETDIDKLKHFFNPMLASGVYVVHVRNGDELVQLKLIQL